jgi:probable rRNA maturation factor
MSSQLERIAGAEGLVAGVLTVVIVSGDRMRTLNRNYHGRDEGTDVLAFDYGSGSRENDTLGEVVVSVDAALEAAESRGLPVEGELLLYCIHGLLHIAGYGDGSPGERARLWQRQLDYLGQSGYPAEDWVRDIGEDSEEHHTPS